MIKKAKALIWVPGGCLRGQIPTQIHILAANLMGICISTFDY